MTEGPWEIAPNGEMRVVKQYNNNVQVGQIIKFRSTRHSKHFGTVLVHRGQKKLFRIALLVMKYFGLSKPSKKHYVHHIDWDHSNNNIKNLEWKTLPNIMILAKAQGLLKFMSPASTPGQRAEVLKLRGEGLTLLEVSKRVGLSYRATRKITVGHKFKHPLAVSTVDHNEMVRQYKLGKTPMEIYETFPKFSLITIRKHVWGNKK